MACGVQHAPEVLYLTWCISNALHPVLHHRPSESALELATWQHATTLASACPCGPPPLPAGRLRCGHAYHRWPFFHCTPWTAGHRLAGVDWPLGDQRKRQGDNAGPTGDSRDPPGWSIQSDLARGHAHQSKTRQCHKVVPHKLDGKPPIQTGRVRRALQLQPAGPLTCNSRAPAEHGRCRPHLVGLPATRPNAPFMLWGERDCPTPSLLRSVEHTRAGTVPRRGIWLTVARAPRRPPAALLTLGASLADGSALAIGVAGKVLRRVTLASARACSSFDFVRQTARPRSYPSTTVRAGADLGRLWSAGHKRLVRPAGACGHHTGRPRL